MILEFVKTRLSKDIKAGKKTTIKSFLKQLSIKVAVLFISLINNDSSKMTKTSMYRGWY